MFIYFLLFQGLSNLYGVFPYYISLENDGNANGVFLLNSNAMGMPASRSLSRTYTFYSVVYYSLRSEVNKFVGLYVNHS